MNLLSLINEYLKAPVGVLYENATNEDEERFFKQHAALETSYLAKIDHSIDLLRPFLESDFCHLYHQKIKMIWQESWQF